MNISPPVANAAPCRVGQEQPSQVPMWTVPCSSCAGSRLADFASSKETLKQERYSAPNWDGYGALPISAETSRNALSMLTVLEAVVAAPEVTPNPNGTVSFEWETEAGVGYLEIGRTKYSFYVKPIVGSAILYDGSTEALSSTLGMLVDDLLYEKPPIAQLVTDLTYFAPNV
ncbi:MAG TPA: hypothetical protein VMH00_13865 [Candidatus Limnocylindrales bacterium]|nr:hypothetical protein [Candidatus Limnocylindrales bacterium]